MKRIFSFFICLLPLLFCGIAGAADAWPSKPIKMIVTYSPGGSSDTLARILAPAVSKILGQPVVVANVGGAGGGVGAATLRDAPADGYTIGFSNSYPFALLPLINKTSYQLDDFVFINSPGVQQDAFFALKERNWKTLKDMFAWAKKENKTLNFGSQQPIDKVIVAALAKMEKVRINPVPLKGGAEAISGVLGSHFDFAYAAGPQMPYIDSGKMTGMATAGKTKFHADIPLLTELGYDFPALDLYAFAVAPKGVDKAVLQKLAAAFAQATQTPEFADVSKKLYLRVQNMNGDTLMKNLREQQTGFKKMQAMAQ